MLATGALRSSVVGLIAALLLSLVSVAHAARYTDTLSDFTIELQVPGSATCVVFPVALQADDVCLGIDLTEAREVPAQLAEQGRAVLSGVLRFPTYGVSFTVAQANVQAATFTFGDAEAFVHAFAGTGAEQFGQDVPVRGVNSGLFDEISTNGVLGLRFLVERADRSALHYVYHGQQAVMIVTFQLFAGHEADAIIAAEQLVGSMTMQPPVVAEPEPAVERGGGGIDIPDEWAVVEVEAQFDETIVISAIALAVLLLAVLIMIRRIARGDEGSGDFSAVAPADVDGNFAKRTARALQAFFLLSALTGAMFLLSGTDTLTLVLFERRGLAWLFWTVLTGIVVADLLSLRALLRPTLDGFRIIVTNLVVSTVFAGLSGLFALSEVAFVRANFELSRISRVFPGGSHGSEWMTEVPMLYLLCFGAAIVDLVLIAVLFRNADYFTPHGRVTLRTSGGQPAVFMPDQEE